MHPDVVKEITTKIEMLKAGKEYLMHSIICNTDSDIELCKILADANQVSIDFLESKLSGDSPTIKTNSKKKIKSKKKFKPLTQSVVDSILSK
jgi:hypothetical protein